MSICCFCQGTSTSQIYTLSLHDALPILGPFWGRRLSKLNRRLVLSSRTMCPFARSGKGHIVRDEDRKSTRLNSSHRCISYAVFCLKKKRHQSESHSDDERQTQRGPHRRP